MCILGTHSLHCGCVLFYLQLKHKQREVYVMNDLISKLLVDENIQDIPVLYVCRIAVELIKLSEERNESNNGKSSRPS